MIELAIMAGLILGLAIFFLKNLSIYKKPYMGFIAVLCLIVILSSSLYFVKGSPGMPDFPLSKRPNLFYPISPQLTSHKQKTLVELSLLISKLQKMLEAEPANPVNWALLGDTLAQLGRFGEAARSYEYALEFDPKNVKLQRTAIYLTGAASYQKSDFKTAKSSWEQLKALLPKESHFYQHVDLLVKSLP